MHDLSYRKELDGIRAIAVVSVILFHVGFPSMPGGYVGVDVFFVLSGYLICGQTYLRLQQGRYGVLEFFARRIRRLSAAYFACFLVTALVGYWLFLQRDLPELYQNLIGAITFTNNYNLLFNKGYFTSDAHLNPYLHTWSLSIEEQFYILLPLLILLTRRSATALRRLMIAMFVISLALTLFSGQAIWFRDQRFFASSFRVWELALGGLVFVAQQDRWRLPRVPFGPMLGLALVIVPVGLFDATLLYPGWGTLAPTLGTALLLATAMPSVSRAGRALASRGMAYIGRISYGAYLWHWPLIVYVNYAWGDMDDAKRAVLVLGSLGLGALSYHLIETPIRRVDVGRHRGRLFAMFGVQSAILLLVAAFLAHEAGKPPRPQDAALQVIMDEVGNVPPSWVACSAIATPEPECHLGDKTDGPLDLLVWGDSMANSAYWAFDDYARETGQRGQMAVALGCGPLPGIVRDYAGNEPCLAFNAEVIEFLRQAPPMEVILFARWTFYGEGFHNQQSNTPNQARLVDAAGNVLPGENFDAFQPVFQTMLDEVGARHKVTVINLWPVVPYHVPVEMLRVARFGGEMPALTREAFEARNGRVVDFVAKEAQARGMTLIEPHRRLCESGICQLSQDGVPLYIDETHLSRTGGKILTDLLLDQRRRPAE